MYLTYLSEYNNYYNRELKGYDNTLVTQYSDYAIRTETNKKFNPNDNVNTSVVINYYNSATIPAVGQETISDDTDIDYIIASENGTDITSRWFVIDRERNAKGQWTLSLRRDLLADFYPVVRSSPIFIEKGWISDRTNKLLFNSENMSFNQIKTGETLLKDKTNSGWYVGYVAPDLESKDIAIPAETDITYPVPPVDYETITSFGGDIVRTPGAYGITIDAAIAGTTQVRTIKLNTTGLLTSAYDANYETSPGTSYLFKKSRTASQDGNAALTTMNSNISTVMANLSSEVTSKGFNMPDSDVFNNILAMNGNTYYDVTNSKLFKVEVTAAPIEGISYTTTSGNFYTLMSSLIKETCQMEAAGGNGPIINLSYTTTIAKYALTVTDLTATLAGQINISPNVETLTDAPYKMFAIPESAVSVSFLSTEGSITSDPAISKTLVSILPTVLGVNLYDIQYLPYCPITSNITDSGVIQFNGSLDDNKDKNISILNVSGVAKTYMLWCRTSSFRNIIPLEITVPTDTLEFKVAHETSFCRICSPNYSGSFQFSPTANYGVTSIEINCTYKPFQPYIHVNPTFSTDGLYGNDYNDQRGLVCGGSFSLPISSNNWINYQIQNSAYQNSFDRQIENMEVTNTVQRNQQIYSAILGGISGTISGAGTGALIGRTLGGGVGAGIGAAAGGLLTAGANIWAAQQDIKLSDKLRAEGIDFSKDMFGYSLQNIKALPNTLSRVSSFDIDNKIFPFIEFYSCSDIEKDALRDKIRYNGMTVMTIGKLSDGHYNSGTHTYFKGQLIKLLDSEDNSVGEMHEAVEIASELMKGVYI